MNPGPPDDERSPAAVPAGRIFSRQVPFVLVVAVAGLLFLLLGSLGAVTDWWRIDESFTYDLIRNSPLQIIRLTAHDVHPPLYYLLLALWSHFWPQPEAMKVFSLLTGLATLCAVAWTGRMLLGRRLGAVVALLWATFPMFLHYCQDARMYPMSLFFETLAVAGWALAPRRPRLGWILFVLALTAALYTQNLCLIFAASLIGGEILRCLLARWRPSARTGSRQTGLAWVLTAAGMIGLLYAPWVPTVCRQMHSPVITLFYHTPTWYDVLFFLGFYPYTLLFTAPAKVWAWGPGVVMLLILPLLSLAGKPRRTAGGECPAGAGQRPLGMLLWIGASSMLFLILYSKYRKPIATLDRHEIMFIPFFLFSAAGWLSAGSRWRRGGTLLLVAVCAAFSLLSLNHSRDKDLTGLGDTLIERAPIGVPILIFPPVLPFGRLIWKFLPLFDYQDNKPIPQNLTNCTLVIDYENETFREEIKRQAQTTVAQARVVKKIYVSYEASAYQLQGLPPGAIQALFTHPLGLDADMTGNQVGRWSPSTFWPASLLGQFMQPKGEVLGFSPINPDGLGARLAAPRTTLKLPRLRPQKSHDAFGVVMFGGYFVGNGRDQILRTRLNRGVQDTLELGPRGFLIARLVPSLQAETALDLEISPELAQSRLARAGDPAPGVYLTWGGYRELKPQDFHQAGVDGLYFDIGALGDDLYLRSGFHEAEGMPPAEVRWTMAHFEMDVPVWPGSQLNEVVLFGILNRAIRDRRISVTVDGDGTGTPLRAEGTFVQSNYGPYALRLPKALAPGVHRLRFTVGTWVPKKEGVGNDPRQLGFYLDGIALRPGR